MGFCAPLLHLSSSSLDTHCNMMLCCCAGVAAQMHGRLTFGFVHVLCRFTEQLFYRCDYESTWITSHHMDFNNFAQLSSILVIYLVAG